MRGDALAATNSAAPPCLPWYDGLKSPETGSQVNGYPALVDSGKTFHHSDISVTNTPELLEQICMLPSL